MKKKKKNTAWNWTLILTGVKTLIEIIKIILQWDHGSNP